MQLQANILELEWITAALLREVLLSLRIDRAVTHGPPLVDPGLKFKVLLLEGLTHHIHMFFRLLIRLLDNFCHLALGLVPGTIDHLLSRFFPVDEYP